MLGSFCPLRQPAAATVSLRLGHGPDTCRVGACLPPHDLPNPRHTIYRIRAIRFIVQSHRVTFRSPLRQPAAATVSLRLGHTRGLTVINCHSIPSCRFAAQSERLRRIALIFTKIPYIVEDILLSDTCVSANRYRVEISVKILVYRALLPNVNRTLSKN